MLKLSNWGGLVWGSILLIGGLMLMLGGLSCVGNHQSVVLLWEGFSSICHPLGFCLLVDAESCFFGSTVCLIAGSVMGFSVYYMSSEKFFYRFVGIILDFVGSMILLIFSPGLLSVFIGWDGLGVSSFLLVIYFLSDKSLNAGLLTLLSNRLGDIFLLLSVSAAWGSVGAELSSLEGSGFSLSGIMFVGIFAASLTKSAQVPFSAWLPAAMAAPTPVSALVHSSTLVTAGLYLLIRFSSGLMSSEFWSWGLWISSGTLVMASFSSLVECDMKKIVALSTLSQLGLMGMAVSMESMGAAFFHLIMHAYFKALLFMIMGYWIHQCSGYQDLRVSSISSQEFNMSTVFTLLALSSLSGVPFLSGFISKDYLLESTSMLSSVSSGSGLLMVLGCVLTVMYSGRLLASLLGFKWSGEPVSHWSEKSGVFWASLVVLSILSLSGGVWLSGYLSPVGTSLLVPKEIKLVFSLIVLGGMVLSWGFLRWESRFSSYLTSLGSLWGLSFLSFPLLGSSALYVGKMSSEIEDLWLPLASSGWIQSSFLDISGSLGVSSAKNFILFSNLPILGLSMFSGFCWFFTGQFTL
uniref:NADH:ubiquinone reductase (H(+)-translocating) n=1 Tax=Tigriopus californicus TaxID=6832 RepID=A2T5A3_TIGCA|nr:NADH dehydrogenase subunit 5 [Tigriopus californicus]